MFFYNGLIITATRIIIPAPTTATNDRIKVIINGISSIKISVSSFILPERAYFHFNPFIIRFSLNAPLYIGIYNYKTDLHGYTIPKREFYYYTRQAAAYTLYNHTPLPGQA